MKNFKTGSVSIENLCSMSPVFFNLQYEIPLLINAKIWGAFPEKILTFLRTKYFLMQHHLVFVDMKYVFVLHQLFFDDMGYFFVQHQHVFVETKLLFV